MNDLQTLPRAEAVERYRRADEPLPGEFKRWHLYGAGLEALEEVTVPLPTPGPDELLVRHDAVGICFSDIKIITLGQKHPKLTDRDFQKQPVVMGHEVALTIVEVGANLAAQFAVGQRYIVQADIFNGGVSTAYGYTLDGGFAQYGIIDQRLLNGDEGCYLIPLREDTGYVEAALVEPWACVVAAYEFTNYRDGLRDGGRLLVVDVKGQAPNVATPGHQPATVTTATPDSDFAALREKATSGAGFDDIVVHGTPSAADLGHILTALGPRGILNLMLDKPLDGKVPVDVGRVHYEQQVILGTTDPSGAASAYTSNTRKDLKPGGTAWFLGSGGPMGQMHVQRVLTMAQPPRTLVVSDNHDARLDRVRARFGSRLAERGVELILVNARTGGDPAQHGPFDDIILMVSKADVIAETVPHLAPGGVYNVFAGLPKGTLADLDLGTMLAQNQRLIGTSGSSLGEIKHTLNLVESDSLSTNTSLAAIGGLDAFREGLEGVKESRYPGKTVIFPHLPDLPLMSVEDLHVRLPNVAAYLQDGVFWTNAAEEELLRERLP